MLADESSAIRNFVLTILGYLPLISKNENITKYAILKGLVTINMAPTTI